MSDTLGNEPSLNPFKNKLALTAICVSLLSGVLLVLAAWRQPASGATGWRLGDTSYTALSTLLSTVLSIGLLALIWEYFLRREYARSLHRYLQLKSAIVSSGLSHIAETNADQVEILENLKGAVRIRAMVRNPVDWNIRYLSAVSTAAQKREVHVEILFPDPDSMFLGSVARSQGLTHSDLVANIENAVATIKTRWTQLRLASDDSTISVRTVDLPLYDVMAADDVVTFELQAACDHEPGKNGLALKFEGDGHPAKWLLSQFDDARAGAALWAAPPGRNDYFRTGS